MNFSRNGKITASSGDDSIVKLWQRNRTLIANLTEHQGWVNSISFSPDNKIIASANKDGQVILWSLNLDDL